MLHQKIKLSQDDPGSSKRPKNESRKINKEMYYKFQISHNDLQSFLNAAKHAERLRHVNPLYGKDDYTKKKSEIRNIVEGLSIGDNNIVDGGSIQQKCFTTNLQENFQVFISHSHADIDLVEDFAITMKRIFDVDCFVDSLVWDNKNEEGGILDKLNEHNIIEKKDGVTRYYHDQVVRTVDHVHAMLSMALMEMIDQCEMGLFVYSDNSVIPRIRTNDFQEATLSSWIYEEISLMNHIRPTPPERGIYEQREFDINGNHRGARKELKITHPLDLTNFIQLTNNIIPLEGEGTEWLDNLYINIVNNPQLING